MVSLDPAPPRKMTKREAGRLGLRSRWGDDPRVVRLEDLHPADREAVLAILRARRSAEDRALAAQLARQAEELARKSERLSERAEALAATPPDAGRE